MGKLAEWILALSCAVFCGAPSALLAKPASKITVKEVLLCEIRPHFHSSSHHIWTDNCRHFAYETKLNGQTAIFLNGKLAGSFEKLLDWQLEGNGRGIVAVASCSNKWTFVSHGTNGPLFDRIGPPKNFSADPLIESPDGSHLAYIATDQGQRFVVLDGIKQKAYDEIIGWKVVFSENSQHYAYLARSNGTPIIVVDGREVASSCGLITTIYKKDEPAYWISPDGRRLAYLQSQGTNCTMIVDGKCSPLWNSVDLDPEAVHFSADSAHFSYIATRSETKYIVLDNREIADVDGFYSSLLFSPDSKRWAYINGAGAVILDDIAGKKFSGYAKVLEFSPDSKNFAYINDGMADAEKCFFVLNGKRSPNFDIVHMLYYHSHHLAIGCSDENDILFSTLFIDGNKIATTKGELDTETVSMSNDGRLLAYTIQREERRLNLSKAVANSKKAVKTAIKSSGSRFTMPELSDSDAVHYVVVDKKEYGPYHYLEANDPVQFSSDSKHFVFKMSDENDNGYFNVDGKEIAVNGIWFSQSLVFDTPTHFHGLLHRDDKIIRIEVDID